MGEQVGRLKAENIGSFDVTPSWERTPPDIRESGVQDYGVVGCRCGLCQLGAAGHL